MSSERFRCTIFGALFSVHYFRCTIFGALFSVHYIESKSFERKVA